MYYITEYQSPIGELVLGSDGEHLVGLWMTEQKYFGNTLEGKVAKQGDLAVFFRVKHWLDQYFAGEQPDLKDLPLAPKGSPFRQIVWEYLCEIPYGEVTTYGAIAKKTAQRLGKARMSAQAIGGAVGHNPIGIIIPCHRVVGTGGNLTGYAGGLDKKIWLLEHEGLDMALFTLPEKGRPD